MSDSDKPSTGTMLITVAWAQFLAMSAAIDRTDMRNVSDAWRQGIHSPWLWQWDWAKFGGVAVALNLLAICFLTLPALVEFTPWEIFQGRPESTRQFLTLLRNLGFLSWLFSFLAFAGYLNFLSVYFLYSAMLFILLLACYYRFVNTAQK